MRVRDLLAIWVVLLATPSVPSQVPSWRRDASGSGTLQLSAAVYDAVRSVVVRFGGSTSGSRASVINETVEWDGTTWTRKNISAPAARWGHSMAFDSVRRITVVFGGQTSGGQPLDDTWTYDGARWSQATPLNKPTARWDHEMVWDERHQRIVLFGGHDGTSTLDDTWEWNGQDWRQVMTATTPEPRSRHAMAYDGNRGVILLYGPNFWELNGSIWIPRLTGTTPPFSFQDLMVWDPVRRIVVYVYQSGSFTWEWNGSSWTRANPVQRPPGGLGAAVAFDGTKSRILLIGGNNHANTWTYGFGEFRSYGDGCPSTAPLTIAPAGGQVPALGLPFIIDITNVPASSTTGTMGLGLSRTNIQGFQLPLRLDFMGMTGCWLLHSNEAPLQPITVTPGTSRFSLSIPNSTGLLHAVFYMQAAIIAPGTNPLGVITSNGGEVVIGS